MYKYIHLFQKIQYLASSQKFGLLWILYKYVPLYYYLWQSWFLLFPFFLHFEANLCFDFRKPQKEQDKAKEKAEKKAANEAAAEDESDDEE